MLQSDGPVRRMFNMKRLPIEGSYLKAISRDPKRREHNLTVKIAAVAPNPSAHSRTAG